MLPTDRGGREPVLTRGPIGTIATGILALAAAMGIGRFAFTPLLPLMLRDGTLDPATGAEWAAANYAGYLAGAVTARWMARDPGRGVIVALAGVAATTLLTAADPGAWAGLILRAAAGLFSAWSLVGTSSLVLSELARRGAPGLGAWLYTGVGVGIALTGTVAWLGGGQPARWLWLELGAAATAAAAVVGVALRRGRQATPPVASGPAGSGTASSGGHWAIVFCYGAFGFGYIVPATFLPAMARQQVSNPLVFGLAWPVFGLAAAVSVAAAARFLAGRPRRGVWAVAQAVMAGGTALIAATQALWAVTASAVLVGGTFMVATMAGLQLARERAPANPTPLLARMTVAFATGQIVGPVLVRLLSALSLGGAASLAVANMIATAVLAATALWLWRGPL